MGVCELFVDVFFDWFEFEVWCMFDGGFCLVEDCVGFDFVELLFYDGWVVIECDLVWVMFYLCVEWLDCDIVYFYFVLVVVVVVCWVGCESFYVGVFVVVGGVWVVLGDKENGKSMMFVWFVFDGCVVLSDDFVVIDGDVVFVGLCCIDLCVEFVDWLGVGELFGVVGVCECWCLVFGLVVVCILLCGWIMLVWDDEFVVEWLCGVEWMFVLFLYCSVWFVFGRLEELMEFGLFFVWWLWCLCCWDVFEIGVGCLFEVIG